MKQKYKNIKEWPKLMFICGILAVVFAALFLRIEKEKEYVSDVQQRECVICKELAGVHKGEKNLGIVNLHEGIVYYVRINRYDQAGNEKEEPDKYFQLSNSDSVQSEIQISIEADGDRGYANIDIEFGDETKIDYEKVSKYCCQECLDNMLKREEIDNKQLGIAVLNYHNNDVKILSQNLKAFMEADYYVNCTSETDRKSGKIKKMELLIFCPKRV